MYGLRLLRNQKIEKRQQASQEQGDQQSAKATVSTPSKVQTKQIYYIQGHTPLTHIFSLPLPLPSHFSRVQLCATPQMAAHQAPLSLGFSRREYWSGLPMPSPILYLFQSKCINIKNSG